MATDKDVQTATRDTVGKARGVADETVRAGETTTRRAADAARSMTEEGAEAGQRIAESGADTMREVIGKSAQAASQTTEQFKRIMGFSPESQGEVAQRARENMDVMVQCGSVLMDGAQSIWREWLGFAQEAMARNAEGVNAMMRCRSVQDLYAAQSDMMRDEMEMLLNRSAKVSELSAQVANDAMHRLNARVEGAARSARRSA